MAVNQYGFASQDGAGREYSRESYGNTVAAGGRRSSPTTTRQMPQPTVGGYVPTYRKYAAPTFRGPEMTHAPQPVDEMPAAPSYTPGAGAYTPPPDKMQNPFAGQTGFKGIFAGVGQDLADKVNAKNAADYKKARQTPLLNGQFDAFKNALASGVEGYADIAGQDFQKRVGTLLGNLNGIGALRSGGVQAGVRDLTTDYARQIGDYSKMTATQAAQLAQTENDYTIERAERDKERDAAQKAAHKHGIGKILGGLAGGAAGFFLGGPAGAAVAGAKAGSEIGG